MKRLVVALSLCIILLTACQEEDKVWLTETGIVADYAGTGNCGFIIELDNGNSIQPLFYPEDFTFTNGQFVLLQYNELDRVINGCDRGVACEVNYIEELSCATYVDLYFENYDSLARDPVFLHEAYLDGDCLYFKISYSGGCQEHTVDLARMHPWTAGSSTVATFEIRHNANNDLCEAYFTKEFRYDLSPLKEEGTKEFILTAKLVNNEVFNESFNLN